MSRVYSKKGGYDEPIKNEAGKALKISGLIQVLRKGFEYALPLLVVWIFILALMAGGAVLQQAAIQSHSSQSSKPVLGSMDHKT